MKVKHNKKWREHLLIFVLKQKNNYVKYWNSNGTRTIRKRSRKKNSWLVTIRMGEKWFHKTEHIHKWAERVGEGWPTDEVKILKFIHLFFLCSVQKFWYPKHLQRKTKQKTIRKKITKQKKLNSIQFCKSISLNIIFISLFFLMTNQAKSDFVINFY